MARTIKKRQSKAAKCSHKRTVRKATRKRVGKTHARKKSKKSLPKNLRSLGGGYTDLMRELSKT